MPDSTSPKSASTERPPLSAEQEARQREIAELNAWLAGKTRLRHDASDEQLAQAREDALEARVAHEAYMEASDNRAVSPTDHAINLLKPAWRVRLRAKLPGGGGMSAKLRKNHEALQKIEADRALLESEQAEALAIETTFESMRQRRRTLAEKITRARDRLAGVRARANNLAAMNDDLYLADFTDSHGSDVMGCIYDAATARAACHFIIADETRLEKAFAAKLVEADREIAAFQRQHDL